MKLNNYIKFFMVFLLFTNICIAKNLECDNSGSSDSTNCVQNLININTKLNKPVILETGVYLISKPILIPSNAQISGSNTKLLLKSNGTLLLKNVKNVTIYNLNFDGGGQFLSTKVPNPFRQANLLYIIGFSNPVFAISLQGSNMNITIKNNVFYGVCYAIRAVSDSTGFAKNIAIYSNTIYNVGAAGIFIINGMNISIKDNKIHDVLGNIAGGTTPVLSDAKFADGIYISGVRNVTITGNNIKNVVRIGIVLEGTSDKNLDLGLINDNVLIERNNISNVNSSRASECNAGIWVEPAADAKNPLKVKTNVVIIRNNIIDNKGAKPGAHIQYGIFLGAKHSIVQNNQISNFTNTNEKNFLNIGFHDVKSSGGIYCVYGYVELLNNKLTNNNVGILFNPLAYVAQYKLKGNVIKGGRFMYYPEIKNSVGVKFTQ